MIHEMDQHAFVVEFNNIANKCYDIAKEHGFHESKRAFSEEIALMHSELSEALEGNRHGSPKSDHISEFSAEEEELADCIIRIMDSAVSRNMKVAQALIAKIAFNRQRPHKHGKKF